MCQRLCGLEVVLKGVSVMMIEVVLVVVIALEMVVFVVVLVVVSPVDVALGPMLPWDDSGCWGDLSREQNLEEKRGEGGGRKGRVRGRVRGEEEDG